MNFYVFKRLVIAIGLICVFASGAYARGGHHGGGFGAPPGAGMDAPFAFAGLPPYLVGINLTDDQQTKIKALVTAQTDAIRTKLDAGKTIHDSLRQLAFSTDYTDDKAKSLADESGTIVAAVELLHVQLDAGIYQLLTADQQQQLKTRIEQAQAASK